MVSGWVFYGFMFVCLREFVFVVFGLWVRGKKYDIWSGKERKYGQWVRERKKKRKKKRKRFRVWNRANLGYG